MKNVTIVEVIALLFVVLFFYPGINKLLDYRLFKEQLLDNPMLKPVAGAIIWGLPLTEFVVSLLLFIPKWRTKGLYASAILMSLFTVYILLLLGFSSHIPCSCGGALSTLTWQQHIVFNLAWITLGIVAIVLDRRSKRFTTQNVINHSI